MAQPDLLIVGAGVRSRAVLTPFAGRLARYADINIDEAVDMALEVFAIIQAPAVDGR